MNEKYIQSLRDTIRSIHKCAARYAQTIHVKQDLNGQPAFDGNVELFDLAAHPHARQCFAWGHKDDTGRWQYITILKIPPTDSAAQAVQSFLSNNPTPLNQ